MMNRISHIESISTDPRQNLALEEALFFHCAEDECILYLWQNQNTVVIGKNQNAWKECDVNKLEAEAVCWFAGCPEAERYTMIRAT